MKDFENTNKTGENFFKKKRKTTTEKDLKRQSSHCKHRSFEHVLLNNTITMFIWMIDWSCKTPPMHINLENNKISTAHGEIRASN